MRFNERGIRLVFSLLFLFSLSACVVHRAELFYDPEANGVQPKQFTSSLRFGVVDFEDERVIPNRTGMKNMVGWGTYTYTHPHIARHVTRAFVKQYNYLGFHARRLPAPPGFSFENTTGLRELHRTYPDIDVFVLGKIRNYQFQVTHTGFMGKIGAKMIRTQVDIQSFYVDARTGHLLWSGTIRKSDQGKARNHKVHILGGQILESNLQQVILEFADRTTPTLNKSFASAISVTKKGMVAHYANAKTQQEVEPSKFPISPGDGRLMVTSSPSGAKVFVDQVFYGTTPLFLDLPPGIHFLKVRKHGFESQRSKIGIFREKTITWNGHLTEK